MSQKSVIKKFISCLANYDSNVTSNAVATKALDYATFESSSHKFSTFNEVVDNFLADFKRESDFPTFLKKYCGIDYENLDTGAIDGLDAGGSQEIRAEDVVAEVGPIKHLGSSSFTTNGLKFNVPSGLNTKQKYVIDALYTWWAKASLDRIEDVYGLKFGSQSAVNEIDVSFSNSLDPDAIAMVSGLYSIYPDSGVAKVNHLDLLFANSYFSEVDTTDANGGVVGDIFSDSVVLHEFVHAVMASNIQGYYYYPTIVKEGLAELIRGADERLVWLRPTYDVVSSYFKPLPHTGVPGTGYALYYAFWRYFAKQSNKEKGKNPVWASSGGIPTHGQLLATGIVPHAYSSWARTIPEGITNIGGKQYLSIPNGWQGRLWHYPWWCGRIYWSNGQRNQYGGSPTHSGVIYNDVQREFFYKQRSILQENIIHDKLLIDFGDVASDIGTDIQIEYPNDFIEASDRNTIIKMKIRVLHDDSTVIFCFKELKNTISIDFGDGEISRFEYSDIYGGMLHDYESAGEYTVTLINDNITNFREMLAPSYFYKDTSYMSNTLEPLYSLVYEVSELQDIEGVYQSETLLEFYINPYFVDGFKMYNEVDCIADVNYHTEYDAEDILTKYYRWDIKPYGFHLNYQKNLTKLYIPYGQYKKYNSYINLIGSNISDLYLYGTCDILNIVNNLNIDNVYCGYKVDFVDVSNLFTNDVDGSHLYMHSNKELTMFSKVGFDVKSDKCTFGSVNFIVGVKSSIYERMLDKYSDIDFRDEVI